MTLKFPTAALSAIIASALTAGALVAFDATAATTQPGSDLQGIAKTVKVLDTELNRQEKRSARIEENTNRILRYTATVYARQGKSNIQFGDPYTLLQEIYCATHDIDPCPALKSRR